MKRIIIAGLLTVFVLVIAAAASFQYSRSWQNALFIRPLYRLAGDEKVVALTFDDGPSEKRTPALLTMLEENNVKASFFMLGENIERYLDIARQVYEKGHLIGNHSYDHPRMIFKSFSFVRNQITKTDGLIKSAGQINIQYFQPPYSSKYIVLPLVLKAMDKTLVTGSFDPSSEYIRPFDSEKVAAEVIENAGPCAVIYLHDGKDSDAQEFVESVRLIITGLRSEGYRFVRLDYQDEL